MVTVAWVLNLTLVVPELDERSLWADPSNFEDIFYVKHFIDSFRDEIRIIKRLPKKFNRKYGMTQFDMSPVSWSNDNYYLQQVLPIFSKHKVLHFNKTDARLANNGIPPDLQKLRCCVNFQALRFTPQIETLGYRLVNILQEKGPFVALHLRYEMDMLAFSGCTHGCTQEEADEVKKETLLGPEELRQFENHSSQMAALDSLVSVACNTYLPTSDGNMAKLVEGHRGYLGFKKTILLDRKRLVELLDMHHNGTLPWDQFSDAVRLAHEKRLGQPTERRVLPDKPKEEDYFYANPQECLCEGAECNTSPSTSN